MKNVLQKREVYMKVRRLLEKIIGEEYKRHDERKEKKVKNWNINYCAVDGVVARTISLFKSFFFPFILVY